MEGLKACPFCGGEAERESGGDCNHVFCTSCGASASAYEKYEEQTAVERWNTRASGWINFKDENPPEIPFSDDSVTVDIWSKGQGRLCDCYRVNDTWYDDMGTEVSDATHWMPLPAAPEA